MLPKPRSHSLFLHLIPEAKMVYASWVWASVKAKAAAPETDHPPPQALPEEES
eukprot:m.181030 g.181030  ORF g.181030 m.181030 type:complete len:53 (+) comp25439_c0_seq1:59-217(+)